MVVVMIGYLSYILVSLKMSSLQIRNAVLCLFHTLPVHETCQCLVSPICFQSLRQKFQVYAMNMNVELPRQRLEQVVYFRDLHTESE